MGKLSKARKRQRIEATFSDADGMTSSGLEDISLLDIATTVRALKYLHAHPNHIRAARFRDVRVALHPLLDEHMKRNSASGSTTTSSSTHNALDSGLTERISDALADKDFRQATLCLRDMRARGVEPKLGAVQRWVRTLEAGDGNDEKMLTLDAILRVTKQYTKEDEDAGAVVVTRHAAWLPVAVSSESVATSSESSATLPANVGEQFRVVGRSTWQQGVQTPESASLPIYCANANLITFCSNPCPSPRRVEVPFVDGAFVIAHALTRPECAQIVHCAEALGFTPDPLGGPEQVEWFADDSIMQPFFARCKPHLPPTLCDDDLRGINKRLRIYRFTPGVLYRPHVDGAWPASGLDSSGKYIYDAHLGQRSRLTMAIYLHEGCDGGETSFFSANKARGEGHLDVQGVTPQTGNALCFPHGDTMGALVHEGSAVRAGRKYLIRTEVLYTTK
eukprot:GEMP01028867.1.p1 GENE.GEMP01028867.1~~GEMP01028867.1.p1  ORF type:complete len:449 (+),score=132.26 GEMP01028867.1:147-1493(+)